MVPLRAVLCDLEGTVAAGQVPIAGAERALAELRERGILLRFLTNIDSQPPDAVREQLAGVGIEVGADELFTPVIAAQRCFDAVPLDHVFPLVSTALLATFARYDLGPPYDHVIVGDCRDRLDYVLLDSAFQALRAGAELIALQRGRYFKRPDGDHLDTGAVVAALEYAAGVTARVLGKPAREFFELALTTVDARPDEVLIVGDDVIADIGGGETIGARTVLVRTGKFADNVGLQQAPSPDHVIDSIADLPDLVALLD